MVSRLSRISAGGMGRTEAQSIKGVFMILRKVILTLISFVGALLFVATAFGQASVRLPIWIPYKISAITVDIETIACILLLKWT